jgi:iron complex outermembrane receptor protein
MDNYIYLMPVFPPVLTIRGAFPSFRYTQVDAVFRGVDAMVSYKVLSFTTLQSKLSLIRAMNRSIDQPLPFIPADRLENTVRFDIPHINKFNHLHLQIALSSVHVSKQRRTPANSDYASAPAGYTLFNAQTSFTLPALHQAEVGLGVSNIFNTSYKDYLNRFRYFTDEMGRNFSVRFKYKF